MTCKGKYIKCGDQDCLKHPLNDECPLADLDNLAGCPYKVTAL